MNVDILFSYDTLIYYLNKYLFVVDATDYYYSNNKQLKDINLLKTLLNYLYFYLRSSFINKIMKHTSKSTMSINL